MIRIGITFPCFPLTGMTNNDVNDGFIKFNSEEFTRRLRPVLLGQRDPRCR